MSLPVSRPPCAWLLGLALAAAPAAAQCDVASLLAPFPPDAVAYGTSLDIDDGAVIVGNESGPFGLAPCYLFEADGSGWSPDAFALPPSDLTTSYGDGVGISGDTAVVAGQDLDDFSWVGYVFERDVGAWTPAGTLDVPFALPQINSGMGVAIEDDVILVSSSMDLVVWVFERQGGDWVLTQTLQPAAAPVSVSFGFSVSLHEGRAVIGGSAPNGPLDFVGTAWVFERVNGVFVETAQLLTVGGETFDSAGTCVAQDDDTIVLGAPGHDLGTGENLNLGAAFVFEHDGAGWAQTQMLTAPTPRSGDAFGMSLAVQGDTLLAGVPFRDVDGHSNAGAVCVLHHDGAQWNHTTTLADTTPEDYAQFGRALAMEDETVLVGAPYAAGGDAPAVRVLRGVPGLAHWIPSAGAVSGVADEPCLYGHGAPAVGASASVGLVGAAADAPTWLVLGLSRLKLPFKGGLLVPNPDVLLPLTTDGLGQLALGWTWPALPAGSDLWLQTWTADVAAPFGFSASNGLSVHAP